MKKIFITLLVVSFSTMLNAQLMFYKYYGGLVQEWSFSVQQTFDSGYIMAGVTFSFGAGSRDVYLIKTDSIGDISWTKTFGASADEWAYSVQQTADSGYVITGYNTNPANGESYTYLIKTNSSGNLMWTKSFGPNGGTGYCVKQTTDGGYIITGWAQPAGGDLAAGLIKTNSNGDTLWTRAYGDNGVSEEGYSVEQTTDGGYAIGGIRYVFGNNYHIYLVKTNTVGDTLWTKTYGPGSSANFSLSGVELHQTGDKGFIIEGTINTFGAGGNDVYLIKTDSLGNLIWSKTFGGSGDDVGYSMKPTTDGGYIIAATSHSLGAGGYLIKTNSLGNLTWSKTFAADFALSVCQTNDGGYAVSGAYGNEFLLLKTDGNGNSCGNTTVNATTITTTPATQVSTPFAYVYSGLPIMASTTLVGSGGGMAITCSTSGISDNNVHSAEFKIYPNPSSDNFTIDFKKLIEKCEVEMLNVYGEKIYSEKIINKSKVEIHLKNVSLGIYFVKISNENEGTILKLIIDNN